MRRLLILFLSSALWAQSGMWRSIAPVHVEAEGKNLTCIVTPSFFIASANTTVPSKSACYLPDGTEFKPHFGPMETQVSAPIPSCEGRKKITQRHGHLWWKHTDTWEEFSKRIKSNSCALVDRHWQPIPEQPLDLAGVSNAIIVEDHACFTKKSELWGKPCN